MPTWHWLGAWNTSDANLMASLLTPDGTCTDHAFGASFTGPDRAYRPPTNHQARPRTALKHYATHYNTRRPHRYLGHRRPAPPPQPTEPIDLNHARIHRRKILGGLINEYDAA
jgi:transposase InsO family protein